MEEAEATGSRHPLWMNTLMTRIDANCSQADSVALGHVAMRSVSLSMSSATSRLLMEVADEDHLVQREGSLCVEVAGALRHVPAGCVGNGLGCESPGSSYDSLIIGRVHCCSSPAHHPASARCPIPKSLVLQDGEALVDAGLEDARSSQESAWAQCCAQDLRRTPQHC
ncbi:hypothetical protein GRJ2_001907400 [Grus japonensis]|uniref:Uncharacterized protein n=1 Tax=Grus japonensis TaxID=30415 RepID=A0ABC9XAF6_GRUJA